VRRLSNNVGSLTSHNSVGLRGLLTEIALLFNIITYDDFTVSRAGVSCYRKCPECVQQNQRDAVGFNLRGIIHCGELVKLSCYSDGLDG
jgi:hypothetical protein